MRAPGGEEEGRWRDGALRWRHVPVRIRIRQRSDKSGKLGKRGEGEARRNETLGAEPQLGLVARRQARFPQRQRTAVPNLATYLSPARYPTPMFEGT